MVKKVQKAKFTKKSNSGLFNILNTFFSALFMVIAYWMWIRYMDPDLQQLGYLILASIFTGFLGSWAARFLTRYYKTLVKPMNYYFRFMLQSVLYALIIWVGLITYLFQNFDLLKICAILLLIKLVLFFASDYYADKITFGG